jgi:hypothetical protein
VPDPVNLGSYWQTKIQTNDREIAVWETMWPLATNTGLLTRQTPGADIDILNPEAAEAVEALARDRWEERGFFMPRIGLAPKRAVLLRTDTPFPKIKRSVVGPDPNKDEKIELLCDGQQMIAFGIHPDTRKPYMWPQGEPGKIKWEDLPYTTAEECGEFVADAVELLCRDFGYTTPATGAGQAQGQTGQAGADWAELIANIAAGVQLHDSITSLAAKLVATGSDAKAAEDILYGLMDAAPIPHDQRWTDRRGEVPAAVRSAYAKFAKPGPAPPVSTLAERDAGDDTGPIPPRRWLLGNQFCRKFLSSLIAPGSTGKSALRLLQFISLAIDRPLTGQHVFRRCRVLLLSFEDDIDELRRRTAAALIHHRVGRADLKGWFFYAAPKGIKLAEMHKGSRQIGHLERLLREAIERRKPDIIGLDPFIKIHALEENDNGAMDFVCDLLATLAIEFDIAVDAPHHARKGQQIAGDADAGRGASGIKDAGRLVYTLTRMTEDEAAGFGINESERAAYVRLDSGKVNIAPTAKSTTWFKLVGVQLNNGTAEYPSGDEVQTVTPWSPPSTWANLSTVMLNAALTEIETGLSNGQRFSDAGPAIERAAWRVIEKHCPGKTEGQYREMIRTWVRNGVLYREPYDDPIARKSRSGLRLNPAKRPS